MMSRHVPLTLLLLLPVLMVAGCGRRALPVYTYYRPLEGATWRTEEELFYTFPVTAGERYRVEGELRTLPRFALRELPLGVVLESPSHRYRTLRMSVPLSEGAKPSSGYVLRESSFALVDTFVPTETGDYTISLRSLLRDSLLEGVAEVGVTVTPR